MNDQHDPTRRKQLVKLCGVGSAIKGPTDQNVECPQGLNRILNQIHWKEYLNHMDINMPTCNLSRYLRNVSLGPKFEGLDNMRRSPIEMCVSKWQMSVRITQAWMAPRLWRQPWNQTKIEESSKLSWCFCPPLQIPIEDLVISPQLLAKDWRVQHEREESGWALWLREDRSSAVCCGLDLEFMQTRNREDRWALPWEQCLCVFLDRIP